MDQRDLNYEQYFDEGNHKLDLEQEYNSHNTYRLDKEEVKQKLYDLYEIQDYIKKYK